MGCTQSTERKQPSESNQQPAVAAEPAEVEVVVAVEAQEPISADKKSVTSTTTVAPDQQLVSETSQESETVHIEPLPVDKQPDTVVEPVAVENTPMREGPTENVRSPLSPFGARKLNATASPLKPPVVPALAAVVPAKTSRKSRAKRSPRGSARGSARGVPTPMMTIEAENDFVVEVETKPSKSVAFGHLPVPVSQEAKKKDRVRKAAGKHYGNISADILLASIAAFERQLTHASSLESQLNC